MNVELMRRIDYYCGIPLCLLLTLLLRLRRMFGGSGDGDLRRALFIELSEMGSAILADPAMRKLQRDTNAELHFVIFSRNAGSLRLLNTIPPGNVFRIRSGNLVHLLVDTFRFIYWVRRKRIDTVIDLELFSRYSALLAGCSGASRRVGFHAFHNEGLYRGDMLTHRVSYNPHIHIAKNFVALIDAALAKQKQRPYSKRLIEDREIELAQASVTAAETARVCEQIHLACGDYADGQRIVLVNPNAGDLLPQRRWAMRNFGAVITDLLAVYRDVIVLCTGSPRERARVAELVDEIGDSRCINFAGNVEFEQLPALYTLASVLLTNDSGPAHFAAVTKLRTVVLFGPETPALYGPLGNCNAVYAGLACSPCVSAANHRKTPCDDNVCMQSIKPDIVLQRLCSELDAAAANREHD